ncbi:MAG: TetR/AcrR family transcriptional regulator [Veillonella sp.]|uniref:TetR/AcrR family transcriptional regulator n=1 Tax=Veillonella sp. TaxID=1926307 RepID=UPI0025CF9E6C|nr:TetR/AcrR family transcriptional regulator [Veillonella sp.]MBS4913212.1 TetR/AcrR family transcriptional regulator [Veillonella sp.]
MAESTKDKIINTTYRLMLDNDDISSITVRMIAAEADVNVALVNYHFKNKDNLFNEVINQILMRAKEFFTLLDDESKPTRQRLFDFLIQYQQHLAKHKKFIYYLFSSKQTYPTQMSYIKFLRAQGVVKIMRHIMLLIKEQQPNASEETIRHMTRFTFSHLISMLVFPTIYSASINEAVKTMNDIFISPEETKASLQFFFDTYFPEH